MAAKFKSKPIDPSEITPEKVYLSRRDILKAMGIVTASAALLAACAPDLPETTQSAPVGLSTSKTMDELGDPLNTYEEITNYNNYYEFTTNKQGVAKLSADFQTEPWTIEVGGLVKNPKAYTMDELLANFPTEERIYRLRCVEAWSMVIPWEGFELAALLNAVEPTADAKYVRFETLMDPDRMPGQKQNFYPWPYQEGLRLDEAMHPLTILATGLYGKPMPNQNGAPIRLVVPWKYGFKSIKAITKIELVSEEPETMWSTIASNEYGFYANVNPNVDHPRWSQSTERRIGELGRRETLMFNGYEEDVASLYEGMDLKVYY
ncbi:protein-methionine-sulfoxide reductase catalytic subunit MsrP [bacterium]|nr:protein-methionine-sulfoxide reductase catalytic subunit MsrP [bacterium]MCB2179170.1 protein-methionine-sulfoxide reductase catalytic subunit MsrP [bacterium]